MCAWCRARGYAGPRPFAAAIEPAIEVPRINDGPSRGGEHEVTRCQAARSQLDRQPHSARSVEGKDVSTEPGTLHDISLGSLTSDDRALGAYQPPRSHPHQVMRIDIRQELA